MLRNQKANLGALVLQGRDLLREIATRRAAVQRLFASATALVNRTKTILGDEPAINQLLAEYTGILPHDRPTRRAAAQPLADPAGRPRNLANVTGSGNAIDLNVPARPYRLVDVRAQRAGQTVQLHTSVLQRLQNSRMATARSRKGSAMRRHVR